MLLRGNGDDAAGVAGVAKSMKSRRGRSALGGLSGRTPVPSGGAHVGDQLFAHAHQGESHQVLAVVAAHRVAAAPHEVGRAVLGERTAVGQQEAGAVGLDFLAPVLGSALIQSD
jgi:hypothetical protein